MSGASEIPSPPLSPKAVLRLAAFMGVAGFGGGLAVIATVRRELVDRARALTDSEFLKYLALAQSLPGGIAVNLFTQLGFRAGGTGTALLCTVVFVLPSARIMVTLAVFYPTLSHLPGVDPILVGLNASVLAIIAAAALQLGSRMPRWVDFLVAGSVALTVSLRLLTVLESILIVVVGALALSRWRQRNAAVMPMILLLPVSKTVVQLPALALVFLQIGISLFGGGMAMIPMLDHQIVARGWLSQREFQDTVTLSQLTPGPIATACTFVGYRLAGITGAVTATAAVFSPPFLLSVIAARSITRFEQSLALRAVLASLGPASVGLIAAAAVSLGLGELHGPTPWVFALGSLFLLLWLDVPPLLVLALTGALSALLALWTR
jgi:chromate transporter